MFNLAFLEFHKGLVCYWHNGWYHFLDSENNLIKIEAPKKSIKRFTINCSVKPKRMFFNRAVGNAIFYENVLIEEISELTPHKFTAELVDRGLSAGYIEVSGLNRRKSIEGYHNVTSHWDTVDFVITPIKKDDNE